MKRIAILAAALSLALAGCNLTAGINSVTAALSSPQATQAAANARTLAVAFIGDVCVLTDLVTGSGVNVTKIQLTAKGIDPATSNTLKKWQAGSQISQSECGLIAQAFTGGKVAVASN